MAPSIKLQSVVLDCTQPKELADFYVSLAGGEITYGNDYFIAVSFPGEAVSIACQLEEDYTPPVWPDTKEAQRKMAHLDFTVTEVDTAVDFALSLGATKPSTQYWQADWGPKWVTLLDPAGHPFCLCAHE